MNESIADSRGTPAAPAAEDTVAETSPTEASNASDATPDSDSLALTPAELDVSDIHAALASLPADTFAGLDAALDHLTSAADLFDVPAIDYGDFHHE